MEGTREGDPRPFNNPHLSLTLRPDTDRPFRWLPRHGEPYCIGEWLSQSIVRGVAWLPVYTAIIVTIILVINFTK